MDDLSDAVLLLASEKIVTRTGAGVLNAEGFGVVGGASTITARMVVWPAPGKDRQQLPEGERGLGLVRFASDTRLYGSRGADGGPVDRFEHDGATFEVKSVEAWGELGNFWAGSAIEVGQ